MFAVSARDATPRAFPPLLDPETGYMTRIASQLSLSNFASTIGTGLLVRQQTAALQAC